MREKKFSAERAVESLLFIAQRLSNPTIHEVLKLRYFADKLHLSAYGFMASGDDYSAMKFGPVASNTYNLLKAARGEQSAFINPAFYAAVDGALLVVDGKIICPLRAEKIELLSPSDVECLEQAIAQYGNMPFKDRTDLSHDKAYEKAWADACENSMDAGKMSLADIAETLENAAEVIDYMRA